MSVLINLLPEARILKLRNQKRRNLATTIMVLTLVVMGSIVGVLVLVILTHDAILIQRRDTLAAIKKQVESKADLESKAVTLQQHITTMVNKQNSRLYVSEIFNQLVKTIPPKVAVTNFSVNTDYKATITGNAPDLKTISTFSKALETYNIDFKPQTDFPPGPIFKEVTITSVSKGSGDRSAYTISFVVDAGVFSKGGVKL